jgi:chitodextrinase
MRKILLTMSVLLVFEFGYSQSKNNGWSSSSVSENQVRDSRVQTSDSKVFDLDMVSLKKNLTQVRERGTSTSRTDHLISFPTADGKIEAFRIIEAPIMHPDLAAKYPGIKSYAGQGVDDPSATIRFSVSEQRGFHGMILSGTRGLSYIDPYSKDGKSYRVYARKSIDDMSKKFKCMTEEGAERTAKSNSSARATDDKKLRKYRLAMSCTAEYGNIFAGSGTDAQKKGNILAQMNITMTRVNGIYERDLAITMELVANNDAIIYYGSANSDPWANEWNNKTQSTIDGIIGDANYDIGHNFNTTGGGNAGCLGCVCTSGSKGSGYTGRTDPTGDAFDVDYVAHEMGHQFDGWHAMNTCSRSGNGTTEIEPASGSTIMGYAGICSTNIQSNSDAYFNYANIIDIQDNVQVGASSGCAQIINLSNNPPTANAGNNYSIPKSTPFILRGQGSDPDGDAITYTWEQNDPEQAPGNGSPASNWTSGPMFRSKEGTTSPDRYMPQISDVVAGNLTPTWEVIPSVARNMEFALTVRDNKAGGGQTADDLMSVTVVNITPFTMSAPNTSVTWNVGQTQTVSWNVGATNNSPVNCANVNILLSVDGGLTYPITLLSNTTNDGSANVTVPNNVSSSCRVMVAAADNIFYDISNTNFSIEGTIACTATVPTGLANANVGSTSADLNWNAVSGASYNVRYRATGSSTWTTVSSGSSNISLSGLTALTEYEGQVRSTCTSSNSAYSGSTVFTTSEVQLNYCASNGNSVADEYIGRVQVGSINNATGAGAGGYVDYTSVSTNLEIGASNNITITPTWTGTVYSEGYAVWIDYNKDGDFGDAGEQVFSAATSKNTSVSGSFTVAAATALGNTRMRVSMKYNGTPTSCESFSYGEVEDYTVNITTGTSDTEAPSTPAGLASSNITETSVTLSWTASSDNVGVTGYDIYVNGSLDGSSTGTNYSVSGLSAVTSYALTVSAKDAAGNSSTQSSGINVLTIDQTAPSVPTGLASSNITETSATLSWTASTDNVGVTGYDIYVNGSLDGSSTGTNYALSGLSIVTSYTLTVRAKDAAGNNSTQSSGLNVLTVDQTAPSTPSGVAVSNITQTSTDLDWTASSDNVAVVTYEVLVDGSVDGSTSSTTYTVSGLTASTAYVLSVRALDDAGNQSANGNVNVTTLDPVVGGGCVGGITSFPYTEGFESGIGAWTQSTSDDMDWNVDASGTPSSSTGPSSATEGSNYLYIESSGNGTGFPTKVGILNGPCFDLSAESASIFSFSYHMYGSSMGTLDLQASTDGNAWTSLWSLSGDQGNAWSSANVDMSAYVGGTVTLRYVGTTSTSYRSDMAIDKLNMSSGAVAGCTDVTLTLIVDNYPEETSWSITDGGGSTVASGSYSSTVADGSTIIEEACLEEGCYTFTINDAYGDGICCAYGNGSYALEDASSTLLASGGSFTNSQATNFCIGASARGTFVERFEPSSEPMIFPVPASDMLYYNAPADLVSVKVMAISGQYMNNVKVNEQAVDVSGLNPGVYMLLIQTEKATINARFIKQ